MKKSVIKIIACLLVAGGFAYHLYYIIQVTSAFPPGSTTEEEMSKCYYCTDGGNWVFIDILFIATFLFFALVAFPTTKKS
jgi:hypothetical protein